MKLNHLTEDGGTSLLKVYDALTADWGKADHVGASEIRQWHLAYRDPNAVDAVANLNFDGSVISVQIMNNDVTENKTFAIAGRGVKGVIETVDAIFRAFMENHPREE